MLTLEHRQTHVENRAMPGAVLENIPGADPAVTEEGMVEWEVAATVPVSAAKRATPDPDPEDEPEEKADDDDDDLDDEDGDDDDPDDEDGVDDDLIDLDDEWDEKDEEDRHDNPHKFFE